MLRALLYGFFLSLVVVVATVQQVHANPLEPVTFSLAAIDPLAERTEEGKKQGLLVKLVEELRKRTEIPIEYQIRPHSRAVLEMEEGHTDFVPTFETPGINEIGKPVADLLEVEVFVLGRAGEEPVDSLSDLNGENIGYLSGTWYGQAFAANEALQKVPVNNVAHGLELLQRHRLKAVVASEVAIPAGYDPQQTDARVRVLLPLATLKGKLYMSNKSGRDEAAKAIAAAVEAMHEDGTMERLFSNRYEGDRARD
ncbi:substrate-binding periplasmic protein [Halomonadaceae bacterium KBTZ08]